MKLGTWIILAGCVISLIGIVVAARETAREEIRQIASAGTTPVLAEPMSQPEPVRQHEPMPSRDEIMRRLKAEADKHGAHVYIFNTAFYEGDKAKYQGIATKGRLFNMYVEDGAEDYWEVTEQESEHAAAWAMVQAMRLPPTGKPMRREKRSRVENKALRITPGREEKK